MRLAARQSDLARLQAFRVAEALQKVDPSLKIEFQFRASLGDLNQTDPLWKMPERGVFTEDFFGDLISGKSDMVVHSWKDLPTETRVETVIAATLPRADVRDVFLFRQGRMEELKLGTRALRVLTSSPRRAYNLEPFFKEYLPFEVREVQFLNVRGNIPTRLRKLVDKAQEADGLVVAKAALDRLLTAPEAEFAPAQKIIREVLNQCRFMVLPLNLNPTAAAQGALAIEIHRSRKDLATLLKKINCKTTFEDVQRERSILASYGGGCHQKIGVTCLTRPYGELTFLRGFTDSGEVLGSVSLRVPRRQFSGAPGPVKLEEIWPLDPQDVAFFGRDALPFDMAQVSSAPGLWLARESAWPEGYQPPLEQVVWSAGLKTWKKLALKAIWVNGSSEGLGEQEESKVENLFNDRTHARENVAFHWLKLTHDQSMSTSGPICGPRSEQMTSLATYRLVPQPPGELVSSTNGGTNGGTSAFKNKKFFFWMSGTAFTRAVQLAPEILAAAHACGPGTTAEHIRKVLSPSGRDVEVYLSYEDWKKELLG